MSDTPRMDLALRKAQEDCTESYLLTEGLKLERELNAANERIKRMEEAGDWMRHHSNNDWWCEKWDETKEAKP